jgi:hypothetical protein
MTQQYRKQVVVDVLNRLGFGELADEASSELPDVVDADWITTWSMKHGLLKHE